MKGRNIFSRLFLSQYYFTIALRKKGAKNTFKELQFEADYIVPANKNNWVADPIIVEYESKAYLFYEKVEKDKGHIEVAEINEDCTLSEAKVILKDECHYSYPFVFPYQGVWYMIPESSASKEVRLYRAINFPTEWELQCILLNQYNVDTTVFEINGSVYLQTFTIDGKSEKVIPHIYKMEFSDSKVKMTEIFWKDYDSLRVRGAGPVLFEKEKLYRPAQISQEQRYGDAIAFYEIFVSENYEEKLVKELTVSSLNLNKNFVDGLHTYCSSSKYEAIDIRCRDFDFFKLIKKAVRIKK